MIKKSIIYKTNAGIEAYTKYVDSLKNRLGAAKIRVRVTRAELGNFGDHKKIAHGIIELRIDYGPGYRVYIGLHGNEVIVLLCAGDKSSQAKDIKKAIEYWDDYKRNL
ncbi:MAG: addiction module killer protein [Elusimicrobia bacterium GWA2_56_46]|jgi:putative addiction module killer protein|nr:MAG: addiction module killer protein [Elusimicrobia bacterium GWA2_56_46]OGR43389.1 MAG: addiction module killer protein [Elusimicrobia bacterium GWA2_56_46]OGR55875.1 MAG: addiction module killer protein [Elusimicrobia bacterium GWC2_56_31]HBB67380.1 addiction module killer protein [Elusimicrobiota bacterium]HBW22192.1 addiction module killer protein [Elusimicrobiota bacterium]